MTAACWGVTISTSFAHPAHQTRLERFENDLTNTTSSISIAISVRLFLTISWQPQDSVVLSPTSLGCGSISNTKNYCLRCQPQTKIRTVTALTPKPDCRPYRCVPLRLGAVANKSLWKFLRKISKSSPSAYEQANQPHLRVRGVPAADRRTAFAAPGEAD